MNIGLIIGAAVLFTVLVFAFLQFFSNRTYKPTKQAIKEIFQASLENRLPPGSFDEFSCVKIAYDKNLDKIREKYNKIVENPEYYIAGEMTEENSTALNEAGKKRLLELMSELSELDEIAT